MLSYLDSNQDKLIQSQMCYRYTIGQYQFFPLKAGAKVPSFLILTKFFFDFFIYCCAIENCECGIGGRGGFFYLSRASVI